MTMADHFPGLEPPDEEGLFFRPINAPGYFEPFLGHTFLPKCEHCGTKHPLAFDPPYKDDACPQCRRPVAKPVQVVEKAVITAKDPQSRFGAWLLRMAERIYKFAMRM